MAERVRRAAAKAVNALFPRDEIDRLLESAAPETLRAAIRAPLPDPTLPVRAIFSYEDPLARRLVLLLKESKSRGAAAAAGGLIAEEVLGWLGDREEAGKRAAAILVPVPLSKSSRRERGYSQTELLCEGAMVTAGRFVGYEPAALEKIKRTQKQALLPRTARLENMRGAFRADAAKVRGRAVALIDDVVTTGATLRACRGALRKAGAVEVLMVALARAP
jgi:ComF family protein